MSSAHSLKHVIKQRYYKERHQPSHRQKQGFTELEKHKDYVKRARHRRGEQAKLKELSVQAALRNPEEFRSHMHNSQRINGVHVDKAAAGLNPKQLRQLKESELGYVVTMRQKERKKIEKLQKSLHLLRDTPSSELKKRHTVFVDSAAEVEEFDPEAFFDTPKELIPRAYNRPTKKMLEGKLLVGQNNISQEDLQQIEKAKLQKYQELTSRMKRKRDLDDLYHKVATQKAITVFLYNRAIFFNEINQMRLRYY